MSKETGKINTIHHSYLLIVKQLVFAILVGVSFIPSTVLSQNYRMDWYQDAVVDRSTYEEAIEFERAFTTKLRRFFDHDKFMVVVDVQDLDKPARSRRTSSTAAAEAPASESSGPIFLDSFLGVDYLPGLQVHPSVKNRGYRNSQKLFNNQGPKRYKHVVNVFMDTSYSPTAMQFAEEIIWGSGMVREENQDEVYVEYQEFPRKYPQWNRNPAPPENLNDEDPAASMDELEALLERKFGRTDQAQQQPQPQPQPQVNQELPKWVPWLVFGIIGLIVIVFLTQFLVNMGQRRREDAALMRKQEENDRVATLQGQLEQLSRSIVNPATNADEIANLAELAELKSYVTREFISGGEAIGEFVSTGVNDKNNDELIRLAEVVSIVNRQLMAMLKTHLADELYDELKEELRKTKPYPINEQIQILQTFRKAITSFRTDNFTFSKKDIFQFVDQLNENQILQLIKDEGEDLIAILLAQLPPNKTLNILGNFEFSHQTQMLQKMSNISDIPVDIYKQVAHHFSQKALKLRDMKFVAVDGIKAIMRVLDSLPWTQQEKHIEEIANYDLELAKKIRERFVEMFNDIPKMAEELVARSIATVEPKVVAISLIGANDKVVDRLLRSKPDREQQLIRSEIVLNASADLDDIKAARMTIVNKIRENKFKE
ncbi:MAG: FliG C-terminal domain-containing protein [Bacteroidota bacterium]|jgi:flagellar motor switch protein FliG